MEVAVCRNGVHQSDDGAGEFGAIPIHFLCPISLEIMVDPVTLCTGITYDRASIDKWLNVIGHNTCPVSNQRLASKDLLPNLVLRSLILQWKINHRYYSIARPGQNNILLALCSSNTAAQQKALYNLIQKLLSETTPSSHLLHTLHSLQLSILGADAQGHAASLRLVVIEALTSLLRTRLEKAVCEKTLEVLEKLPIASLFYGAVQHTEKEGTGRTLAVMKDYLQSDLVPTLVVYTMVGISSTASLLCLHILCRVCKEEEGCSRAAAKSGAVSKALMLLNCAHSSVRIKRKALRLLKRLSGQPCRSMDQ